MKLRYFIPSLIAVIALFASCSDDNDPTYLDEIRLSSSYVALDVNGGTTSIDLTAADSWSFEPEGMPEWLTVSPAQGGAGVTTVNFSADATIDGRTAELLIRCGNKTQRVNVIQGLSTVSNATCAEVIAGPDSKTYRVTGTCTSISNTTYGNWYLTDETGEIYIYGTLDAAGNAKNFLSLGLEVGDIVTVEGPKTTYNGTVELVDVTVLKIEKSLIKCDSLSIADATMPLEGGDIIAYLSCKGEGVSVEIPAEAKDWLSITSVTGGAVPTVTFHAAPNTGGDRNVKVVFKTTANGKEYTSETIIYQKGAIVEVPVADFLAAEVGDTQYRMTGVITELYESDKQGKSFYVQDYSGKVLVYRAEGFIESGAKVGDIVTVVGKRGAYKETPQMVSGTFEELKIAVTEVSIAEFLTKEDSKEVYYMVTGTVKDLFNDKGAENDYGNLHITDGTNDLYVYGCYPGYGATGDFRKGFIKAANIEVGDKLTMIGYKSTYNGLIELCGGICFSYEKAE